MRGTTVPCKEQNKAFDEEIGQPGERVLYIMSNEVDEVISAVYRSSYAELRFSDFDVFQHYVSLKISLPPLSSAP